MNSKAARAWIFIIAALNSVAFPVYFYFVLVNIPHFFDGSWTSWWNLLTALCLFFSGIQYILICSWISVVCSDGPIVIDGFFSQIYGVCFWSCCINLLQGQWILFLIAIGILGFWACVGDTCFSAEYVGISDHLEEEPTPVAVPTTPQPPPQVTMTFVNVSL